MPTPKKNETKDKFISRCIATTLKDKGAKNTAQAVAICNYVWARSRK